MGLLWLSTGCEPLPLKIVETKVAEDQGGEVVVVKLESRPNTRVTVNEADQLSTDGAGAAEYRVPLAAFQNLRFCVGGRFDRRCSTQPRDEILLDVTVFPVLGSRSDLSWSARRAGTFDWLTGALELHAAPGTTVALGTARAVLEKSPMTVYFKPPPLDSASLALLGDVPLNQTLAGPAGRALDWAIRIHLPNGARGTAAMTSLDARRFLLDRLLDTLDEKHALRFASDPPLAARRSLYVLQADRHSVKRLFGPAATVKELDLVAAIGTSEMTQSCGTYEKAGKRAVLTLTRQRWSARVRDRRTGRVIGAKQFEPRFGCPEVLHGSDAQYAYAITRSPSAHDLEAWLGGFVDGAR